MMKTSEISMNNNSNGIKYVFKISCFYLKYCCAVKRENRENIHKRLVLSQDLKLVSKTKCLPEKRVKITCTDDLVYHKHNQGIGCPTRFHQVVLISQ